MCATSVTLHMRLHGVWALAQDFGGFQESLSLLLCSVSMLQICDGFVVDILFEMTSKKIGVQCCDRGDLIFQPPLHNHLLGNSLLRNSLTTFANGASAILLKYKFCVIYLQNPVVLTLHLNDGANIFRHSMHALNFFFECGQHFF